MDRVGRGSGGSRVARLAMCLSRAFRRLERRGSQRQRERDE
ncbi:hypothetical protein NJ7G_3268 [Natrinema sp. J7-2]|nr:hypothetical protein NJ7G_3268 [Natrinema sp. J7-2]